MSNAKLKREVKAHIEFRNRKVAHPVVTVARPHEVTVAAIGKRVILKKDGKPAKRKGVIVAWRKVDVRERATLVEVPSSMGRRPNYVWHDCANR